MHQSEEETSSGGDQLLSNKTDAYTKKEGWVFLLSSLTFFGKLHGSKTHLSLDKYTYHLMKLIRCWTVSPRCESRRFFKWLKNPSMPLVVYGIFGLFK